METHCIILIEEISEKRELNAKLLRFKFDSPNLFTSDYLALYLRGTVTTPKGLAGASASGFEMLCQPPSGYLLSE